MDQWLDAYTVITSRLVVKIIEMLRLTVLQSLMIINMSTSMDEFINTYNHEKNHIEMHICDALNIDPFSEEASDLSGYIAQSFYFAMVNNYM